MPSCRHAHSRCSASRPIPIAKVKSKPTRGLGLGFDLWPFDVRSVHADVLSWTMSIDFAADSSRRFPFRARTNRQTDKQIDAPERPTHTGGFTAGVGTVTWLDGKVQSIGQFMPSCKQHKYSVTWKPRKENIPAPTFVGTFPVTSSTESGKRCRQTFLMRY